MNYFLIDYRSPIRWQRVIRAGFSQLAAIMTIVMICTVSFLINLPLSLFGYEGYSVFFAHSFMRFSGVRSR